MILFCRVLFFIILSYFVYLHLLYIFGICRRMVLVKFDDFDVKSSTVMHRNFHYIHYLCCCCSIICMLLLIFCLVVDKWSFPRRTASIPDDKRNGLDVFKFRCWINSVMSSTSEALLVFYSSYSNDYWTLLLYWTFGKKRQ